MQRGRSGGKAAWRFLRSTNASTPRPPTVTRSITTSTISSRFRGSAGGLLAGIAIGLSLMGTAVRGETADLPRLEVQTGHLTYVSTVAFLDRNSLVASDMTGAVRVWDVALNWSRQLETAATGQRYGLAILEGDVRHGWVAGVDYGRQHLDVRRLDDGSDLTPPTAPPVSRLVVSPDRTRVTVLAKDGRLQSYDAATWAPLPARGGGCTLAEADRPGDSHGNPDFVFTPDGRETVVVTQAGQVSWIDRDSGCARRSVLLVPNSAFGLVAVNTTSNIVTLARHDRLMIYRLDAPDAAPVVLPSDDGLRRIRFSGDGRQVFEGYEQREVRVTPITGGPSRSWEVEEDPTALEVAPDGRWLAVGLFSGHIRLISIQGGSDRELSGAVLHASALAASGDGTGLIVRGPGDVIKIDLAKSTVRSLFPRAPAKSGFGVSQDGAYAWMVPYQGKGVVRVVSTGRTPKPWDVPSRIPVAFWTGAPSPDRRHYAVSYDEELRLYDGLDGSYKVVGRLPHPATTVAFGPDGRWLAAVGEANALGFIDLVGDRQLHVAAPTERGVAFDFSPDGRRAAVGLDDGGVRLVSFADLRDQRMPDLAQVRVTGLRFDARGTRLAVGRADGSTDLVDVVSGRRLRRFERVGGDAADMAFLDGETLSVLGGSGEIRTWSIATGETLFSLLLTERGGWVAVAPGGGFDSPDAEHVRAVSWVMSDDVRRPLPAEVFMRDYFEPRLIPRILDCRAAIRAGDTTACTRAFQAPPSLASLNRVRPTVSLAAGAGLAPDEVVIRWGAGSADDASQPNHKTHTEAYDLRLFRDGQLVGRCPAGTKEAGGAASERQAWREAALVRGPCRAITVRLPSGSGPVTFSAYAFNEDRVKSETVEQTYTSPAPRPARVRHAYVVAMGVDHYAGSGRRDLTFAVKDARDMSGALGRIAGYQVTQVLLTAPKGARSHAAKADLAAVLAILAGDERARARLAGVPGLQDLHAATPDDLVILTFSGHGHTTEDGAFYLLPSDADPTLVPTPATLAGFVSSQDLSRWLETVDAGQLALVIDACHSGASVPKGFKPGPMGDRGLGQLAYDKGMRILAASQADDVALEVRRLRQGLLTYALVQEGLGGDGHGARADLDGDGVTLSEWLAWGEARTPGLYQDVIDHKIRVVRREDGPAIPMPDVVRHTQTPALYDFHRQSTEPVIVAGAISAPVTVRRQGRTAVARASVTRGAKP